MDYCGTSKAANEKGNIVTIRLGACGPSSDLACGEGFSSFPAATSIARWACQKHVTPRRSLHDLT